MKHSRRSLVLSLIIAVAAGGALLADDWPQWRGPSRDGVSRETGWLAEWPAEGPPVAWEQDVGRGYAAVCVVGDRVYTMGNDGANDVVWCLQAADGSEVWRYTYACKGGGGGWPGTRTAPAVDGDRLYTLSLKGLLLCLNAQTGDVVWQVDAPRELGAKGGRHGFSCHPLVVDDLLIVELGAQKGNVVAFDKLTGDVRWQASDTKCGHSSPILAQLDAGPAVLLFAGDALVALRPQDGGELWRFPCRVDYLCGIATPVLWGTEAFISSSYYKLGSTLLSTESGEPVVRWHSQEIKSHCNGGVLLGDHLYGFDGMVDTAGGKGVLKCIDMRTGRAVWQQAGFGTGSVALGGSKLLVLSDSGELIVADASPGGFSPISRAKVLDGRCWTVPVLANGRLYCRNFEGRLVCLDLRVPAAE